MGPSFQDPNVRRALQMGIDQNAIGKILDGPGLYLPDYSANPSGFPGLTKAIFGVATISNQNPFNPAAGKALLEKDGWRVNPEGVMEGQVFPYLPSGVRLWFDRDAECGLHPAGGLGEDGREDHA